jgi:hypothetical protein
MDDSVRCTKTRVSDQDPVSHFNANPDPAFHFLRIQIRLLLLIKVMEICDHSLWTLQGSIFSFQASIVSVYGPPQLYLEPLKLLNFAFNAETDPAFHSNADLNPDLTFN